MENAVGSRRTMFWLGLLAAGEAADLATTRLGLALGTHETNPLALWLMSRGLLEGVKLGLAGLVIALVWLLFRCTRNARAHRTIRARAWAVRGTQVGAVMLVVASFANLGMIALQITLS